MIRIVSYHPNQTYLHLNTMSSKRSNSDSTSRSGKKSKKNDITDFKNFMESILNHPSSKNKDDPFKNTKLDEIVQMYDEDTQENEENEDTQENQENDENEDTQDENDNDDDDEEDEEDEHDYGIIHTFELGGKTYGVYWLDNLLYEMDGKLPKEKVGTWDQMNSYPVFEEKKDY